jgi:hypothetical protein
MKDRNNYLYWLYMAGCLTYVGYEAYSYTGMYRLAAEWQMNTLGHYSEKLTFLVPLLVLAIPGAVIARLLGLVELKHGTLEPKLPPLSPRILLVAGLVLVAVAVGAGWQVYASTTANVTYEAFDLSKSRTPPSDHVRITGVAHPEYEVGFGKENRPDHYVPVTAKDWRPGDPLVYFLKTHTTVYTPSEGGRTFDLSKETEPFPLTTQPGVLVDGGLPGPVTELYRKQDVLLAPLPVVLDHAGAEAAPYGVAAAFTGVGGIWCLVAAATMAFRQRRQAKA